MTPAAAPPPLRVLHVDTERGWRGGERQVLWLADGMQRRGHVVRIAARPGEALARRATAAGLPVDPLTPRGELDVVAAYRLRRLAREHRVQIVHAHTAHAAALAALATFGTGIRVVVARRVDFPLRRNVGTRFKYRRADAVIAVSRAVADIVIASGVDRSRVHVVVDGVDTSRQATPLAAAARVALGVPSGGRAVVQVAALVPHKDPLMFVRAMAHVVARVPEARGLLVGDGPLRDEVLQEIDRLGLTRSVISTGFLQNADAVLASADVATLSSAEEGMGSVLLDAMLFEIPIAATRAGGIPEVVIDGESGLLSPPRDPVALAANIIVLLEDRDRARALSAQARVRVEQFSIDHMVDGTIGVYARALARA